jgi:8-oxo-dGTP pyrophosphatase MutT (NUDIX family)
VIRKYTVPDVGQVQIADAQFSVTGSVGVREMEPFAHIVTSVGANVEFRNDAMRIVHDACGAQKDAFNQMLRTVAQRETFEETGFFCDPHAFDFVRFERNWVIFKVHASQLRARSLEGCRAFVAQNPQELPFRAGRIPFKVQVYVYGTRQELQALIRNVRLRPAVERDIAGLVLYKAGEIEQFRVV